MNAVRVSEYRLELGVWCVGRGCPIVFVHVRTAYIYVMCDGCDKIS